MEKANQNAKPPARKINANLSNKEKMKQANREFAKRSRLRKLQECGELEAITISLEKQVSNIREEIKALLERCETLEKENSALMAELEEERGPEVIAELEEHEPEVIAELEEEHGPEVIADLKAKKKL